MPSTYVRTLTIAGSDSGGGAGIQADLKTFSALGCYGMSVITALTAQNTTGVQDIHPVSPGFVRAQLDSVLQDIGTDAVKIGMLHRPKVIEAVAGKLKHYNVKNVVLDPVMVAQRGDRLLTSEAVQTLKTQLFPLSTLLTPNRHEAEVLTGMTISRPRHLKTTARKLLASGAEAVLVKGGHLDSKEAVDCLVLQNGADYLFESERVDTPNLHGTGCTLSSAVAAYLAKQYTLVEAVRAAKVYITGAIKHGAGYTLGKGRGPVRHFYKWWDE